MLFANNCNTTLNGGITAVATSMVVTSATGFPSPTGSQYFYCTLADAATQTTIEIVKVTAVSGTTFTIVRGQDGTTGTIFASGAVVSLRLVRANLNDFPKLDEDNTFAGTITFSTPLLATNMVQSNTSTSGYLSATDWTTFNGKAPAVTYTTGYIPFGQGTTTPNQDSSLFWDNTNKRLGVGTSSPQGKLTILTSGSLTGDTDSNNEVIITGPDHSTSNSLSNLMIFSNTTAGAGLGGSIGFGGLYSGSSAANFAKISGISEAGSYLGALAFYSRAAGGTMPERMRISSAGTLSIGTTGGDIFNQSGVVLLGGTSPYIGTMHASGSASGSSYALFAYNAGIIGSISQAGTTGVLYNVTSDYRLKSDVTPIQNALAIVEALNPVSFTWIDGRHDDGFIAHELQAVIPNCVTGEKDAVNEDGTPKYQQMDNSGVIPFLVKAIQEQQSIITTLQTQIAALNSKVGI